MGTSMPFFYFWGLDLSSKIETLKEIIEPVVTGLEYDFWGLEFASQGKYSVLCIYIDSENGITVDDCASVSRQVGAVLDVEDPIKSQFTLEVSSPGMDRPLFTASQFEKYKGHVVELRLTHAFEGRRKFKGQINGLEDGDLLLIVDNEEFVLPVDQIEKANLVPVF